jgi:predicted RND superfamily exporter protein
MTVAALLLAIAWSFGYVTLMIGHLNILSVSFGVILIGLGIDFGVHYVARYLQLRNTVHDTREALVQTASSVGPGVVTGGLSTALAFCTADLTRFTGIDELGVIAGGGIILCIFGAIIYAAVTGDSDGTLRWLSQ